MYTTTQVEIILIVYTAKANDKNAILFIRKFHGYFCCRSCTFKQVNANKYGRR
jgi:hypothetical protein